MVDRARRLALLVLRRVSTQGAFLSAALRAEMRTSPELDERDRAFATELTYGVVRRRAQIDRAIGAQGKRLKDFDPRIHDALRLGAYQLLFLDRVPDHAAVDTTVELVAQQSGKSKAAAVNRTLRALAAIPRDARLPPSASFLANPLRHIQGEGSLPKSIAEVVVEALGAEMALAFARASLERAPLVMRANRLRTTRDALVAEIGGVAGAHPLAVHLPDRLHILPARLPCVEDGRATVQDEASMHVVSLVDPQPGDRVLDLCAAPGGKSTAIAECMGDRGEVHAHDRTPQKLAQIEQAKRRLGLEAIRIIEVLPSPSEAPFDRVLVDAPCSGLGTLRRHPEIRWRFVKDDLARLTALQRQLIARATRLVRPGGVFVYSVCTVTKEEGEDHFRDGLSGFEHERTLRCFPDEPGRPDGFFAARFVRK